MAPPVLGQLLLDRCEHIFINDRRHEDRDLILGRGVGGRLGTLRVLGATPLRPQPRPGFRDLGLAEGRRPLVRRVSQHPPDRRPIPGLLPSTSADTFTFQPAAHLADRTAFPSHPGEDPCDDARLLQDDLVASLPAPRVLADVAVTVGRPARGR